MSQNHSLRRRCIKKIFILILIISFFGTGIQTLSSDMSYSVVSAQQDTWELTLRSTGSEEKECSVIIGCSPNASDGVDELDYPIPPAPPTPYIRAWFNTPFSLPYNNLLQEYKHISSPHYEWNLSIIWVSESENNSPTTINITWDSTPITKNHLSSLHLYENNTAIVNMLNDNSYSYQSNETIHHFKIIGQAALSNGDKTQNDLPVIPIIIGISGLIIVIVIALFWYKRKK
jgi:hypothetical protein